MTYSVINTAMHVSSFSASFGIKMPGAMYGSNSLITSIIFLQISVSVLLLSVVLSVIGVLLFAETSALSIPEVLRLNSRGRKMQKQRMYKKRPVWIHGRNSTSSATSL